MPLLASVIAVTNTSVFATGVSNLATSPGSPIAVVVPALATLGAAFLAYLSTRDRRSKRPDPELTAQAAIATVEANLATAKAELADDLDRLSRRVDRIEEHMWDRPTT